MKYYLKKGIAEKIKRTYKNKYFVETVGISTSFVSLILNRRKGCDKTYAYSITKAINSEAEIRDFFEVA